MFVDKLKRETMNLASIFLMIITALQLLFPFNPGCQDAQAAELEGGIEPKLTVVTVTSHCDWAWVHTRAWHEARYADAIQNYLIIMREYPNYVWQLENVNQELLPFLARADQDWPGLADEFWQRVRQGRIEIVVGFSNPRISEVYPETFVRDLIFGKEYFRSQVPGIEQKLYSAIDVMNGHTQMPQLLTQAEFQYFEFQRKNGPQRVFWYKGLDGTRMLYSRNFALAGNPEIIPQPQEFNQVIEGIQPVPVWRIGIGMDDAMPSPEIAKLASTWDPKKKILGTMSRFFEECEKYSEQMSELEGPLDSLSYYSNAGLHGNHNIYTLNNQNEDLLLTLEKAQSMATMQGQTFLDEPLDPLWQDLLSCTGHAMTWLFKEDYEERLSLIHNTHARANRLLEEALSAVSCAIEFNTELGTPLIVFNFHEWPVSGPVEFYVDGDTEKLVLKDIAGKKVPLQLIKRKPTKGTCLTFMAEQVPACGYITFYLSYSNDKIPAIIDDPAMSIENTYYRIQLNSDGKLKVFNKRNNRILSEPQEGGFGDLVIYDLPPSANWEHNGPAGSRRDWQVDSKQCQSLQGSVFSSLRAQGTIGPHEIMREVRLWHNSKKIEYLVEIDAKEDNGIFCVRFPVGDSDKAVAGIPFGVESRDNLANEPFRGVSFSNGYPEGYYATRWTDVSDVNFGYTFICPPGMHTGYSFQKENQSLEFILLHLRTMPVDVFRSSHPSLQGKGRHAWHFALVPHEGTWQKALSYRHALEQHIPMLAYSPWYSLSRGGVSADPAPSRLTGPHPYFGTLPLQSEPAAAEPLSSFVEVSPSNVVLSSMRLVPSDEVDRKPQFELRLYETTGQSAYVIIKLACEVSQVQQMNFLSEPMDLTGKIEISGKEIRFGIQPWKIVTLRVNPAK